MKFAEHFDKILLKKAMPGNMLYRNIFVNLPKATVCAFESWKIVVPATQELYIIQVQYSVHFILNKIQISE